MDFMTTKEAVRKWEVAERMVQYYCKVGRIIGAVKLAGVWLISKEANKSDNGRRRKRGNNCDTDCNM